MLEVLLGIGIIGGLTLEGVSFFKDSTKLFVIATVVTVVCGVTLSQI